MHTTVSNFLHECWGHDLRSSCFTHQPVSPISLGWPLMLPDCLLSSELCPSTWWLLGKDSLTMEKVFHSYWLPNVPCKLQAVSLELQGQFLKRRCISLSYHIYSISLSSECVFSIQVVSQENTEVGDSGRKRERYGGSENDSGNVTVPTISG